MGAGVAYSRIRRRLLPDLSRFFRGRGPEPGPVTLDLGRVFILPTREGWVFGLILLAILLGALNYDNSLAYGLAFLLAGVAVVGTLHTVRNLHGLVVRPGRCAPVFAGGRAVFTVGLHNPGPAPRLGVGATLAGGAAVDADLAPGETRWLEQDLPAARRGRLAAGPITLSTRFPLLLFRAWSPLDLGMHCLVYPRPAAPRPLPPASGAGPGVGGDGSGRDGDDFAALRGYQSGDSLGHVHWKAVARGQGLLTKEFGGAPPEVLWLSWEQLPGRPVEERLGVLCRWVLTAEARNLEYGLRLPGRTLEPDHGGRHRRRCLEALALFGEGA